MALLLTTLLFLGVAIGATWMIAHELARPLTLYPASADDVLFDQMIAANARQSDPLRRRTTRVRVVRPVPLQSTRMRARLTRA